MSRPACDAIIDALASVRRRVAEAAAGAGRDAAEVTLIAVSKEFGAGAVRAALAAGQMDFGENRAQELAAKAAEVGPGPRWHFVGRLQRNKVARVLETNPVIHSVDRPELARHIAQRARGRVPVLIEVNVSGEAQKGGAAPGMLAPLVEEVLELPALELVGLMGMAPRSPDPEESRPAFRQLAQLRAEMARQYSCPSIHHLSMGMSQDYQVAIQEGATMVRVGEAIFGRRTPRPAEQFPIERGKPER